MIITRYLIKEILKNQFIIVIILFITFFCQKLVKILNATVGSNISNDIILSLLVLGVSEMAQLILPLSLSLGLLKTLNRMCIENEIIAMHACGIGKNIFIRATLLLSIITAGIAAINVIWFSPWSSRYQHLVVSEIKANPSISPITKGQFKLAENGSSVLFISNFKNKKLERIFLAQLKPNGNKRPYIIVADYGYIIKKQNGSQIILLNNAIRYEGSAKICNLRITNFTQYKAVINHQKIANYELNAKQMTIIQLWRSKERKYNVELHWRITLIISGIIMSLIALPLSTINIHKSWIINVLPTILLYLFFFLLQNLIRSNLTKDKFNPIFFIWSTNIIYLMLAIILNLWNTMIVKQINQWLHIKRAI